MAGSSVLRRPAGSPVCYNRRADAGIASLRGASTIAIGGVANPAVSVAEDVGSIGALFLTFVAPLIGALLAAVFTIGLAIMIRTAYRKLRSAT